MAVAGGVTQGTFGYAYLNGTVVTLRPGASQAYPLNPDIPAPLNGYGGYGAMNYSQGLQFPQWNLPCVPLDYGAVGNWFSAANLNAWFIGRSSRPVWDLAAFSNFTFSENGSVGYSQGIWNGLGVKGAGLTISGRKGQGIAVMMRLAGVSAYAETDGGNRPSEGVSYPPLSFNRISFGGAGAFDGIGVVGFTIQLDTGLTPNMELDGTYNPVEQNGGTPSCTLTLELNALDAIAPPGWDATTSTQFELTNQTVTIQTYDDGAGSGNYITFTFRRLLIRDPRNRQGTAGRAMRSHTFDCLAAVNAQPLGIS